MIQLRTPVTPFPYPTDRCLRFIHVGLAIVAILSLATSSPAAEVTAVTDPIRHKFSLSPFYQKQLLVGQLPIVASGKVSDMAMLEAAHLIRSMLAQRRDILTALAANRVRFVVMAAEELTTDIPEHSDLTPRPYWDRRARGLGPTPQRPAVSCGEENLLRFPGDPYATENILIHEFAHAIHLMGLQRIDTSFQQRLESCFNAALADGLWEGTYAASNANEYWAEGVQSYFGTNRPPDHDHNHVDTRDELRRYDHRLFELIKDIFVDSNWQYSPPQKRTHQPHLQRFPQSARPPFQWPTRKQTQAVQP
ncbi:MAG: hypothetical protein GY768_32365 [Planctomycetaceae bacterium]|nr:hypothetical protein [Planctomycetaceae bacterium]